MSIKPLRVEVAEAIGWQGCRQEPVYSEHCWTGVRPEHVGTQHGALHQTIPHYDTDWSATGPLIEKYKIMLCPVLWSEPGKPPLPKPHWHAAVPNDLNWDDFEPLRAVCGVLLLMGKAGLLKSRATA